MKLHGNLAAARRIAGLLLMIVTCAVATCEAQTTDPRVADLVRAGKLRVGLFLPEYGKGPEGLKTTVWVETARAYAARVGVPLAIVEHATPLEAIACLKAGSCDQLFLALDARAAEIGDFSNPIFQFDYTLMVPAGFSIAKVADADRPRSNCGCPQSRLDDRVSPPSETGRIHICRNAGANIHTDARWKSRRHGFDPQHSARLL